MVSIQLVDFLSEIRVLTPTQYAYRPKHSTEDAVVDAVGAVAANRDKGLVTCVTSCDLSKAFDAVDRDTLFTKLKWYGVSDHWLRDYFRDRSQSVQGGSSTENVDFGVVQGSTLGPILFNMFTNDVTSHLSDSCKIVSYADDSVLLHSAPPTAEGLLELRKNVEGDLATLSTWFRANGLKANPNKTDMTVIGTPSSVKRAGNFQIIFDGVTLTPTDHIKMLGITIDQHLSMEKQTCRVIQRCYCSLVTIKKLCDSLPPSTITTLIRALVMPHLMYCLPAWAPPSQNLQHRINKVLNFAIRIVTKKRKCDHVSAARKQLGWMSFQDLIQYRDCALVHRLVHEIDTPASLRSLVCTRADVSERTTRETTDGKLHIRRCKLEATHKTVPVRAFRTWNRLPHEMRKNSNPITFRSSVKAMLVNQS